MCVAILVPKDCALPDNDTLEKCALANGDGAGVAWCDRGLVRWRKGFMHKDTDEFIKMLRTLPPNTPKMIHFRIATCGGVRPELTHPFPLTRDASVALEGSAREVLVHNGTVTMWRETTLRLLPTTARIPAGPWSDTRALALLAHHRSADIFSLMDEGKIATLNRSGNLWWWGNGWSKIGDLIYSNLSWQRAKHDYTIGYYNENLPAVYRNAREQKKHERYEEYMAKKEQKRLQAAPDLASGVVSESESKSDDDAPKAGGVSSGTSATAEFAEANKACAALIDNSSSNADKRRKRALYERAWGGKIADKDFEELLDMGIFDDLDIKEDEDVEMRDSDLVVVNGNVTKVVE